MSNPYPAQIKEHLISTVLEVRRARFGPGPRRQARRAKFRDFPSGTGVPPGISRDKKFWAMRAGRRCTCRWNATAGRSRSPHLRNAAQVTSAVGIAEALAGPVMRPVHALDGLECLRRDIGWGRDTLYEPRLLPRAVEPRKHISSQRIRLTRSASSDSGSPPLEGRFARSSLTMPARARRSHPLATTEATKSHPSFTLLRPRRSGYPENARWQ